MIRIFIIFISLCFCSLANAAEIDRMVYRGIGTNYYTNFEYKVVISNTNVSRWIVLPKNISANGQTNAIEDFSVMLLMLSNTNGGYIETTPVLFNDLTNQESGFKWIFGNVSTTTMATLRNSTTAVRAVCLSNTITLYIVAGVRK